MMKNEENYIFYIQYEKNLSIVFFSLSEILKNFNITLIPVKPVEIIRMTKGQKQFAISITSNLTNYKELKILRKRFLDFALNHEKICLFDFSSFGKIPKSFRLERNSSYFHFPLPMKYNEIATNIVTQYFNQIERMRRWPGGRRARIPEIG